MIYLRQLLVVEGKYDIIKLSEFLGSLIISTDGFSIFKDVAKQNLIKSVAKKIGIVILTDSDFAGKKIATFVLDFVESEEVFYCMLPKIIGKEKRKSKNNIMGVLGVESIKKEVIVDSFKKSGIKIYYEKDLENIKRKDFIDFGFFGTKNSSLKRKQLLKYMGFEVNLSFNRLVSLINILYDRYEFFKICEEVKKGSNL